MTDKLDQLLDRHGVDYNERKKIAEGNIHEALTTIFAELPAVNIVAIRGYTPGFNDGDPCTHSQQVAVDIYDPEDIFYSLHDYDGKYNDIISLFTSRNMLGWGTNLEEQTDPHIINIIKAAKILNALEGDFSTLHDTNFMLTIKRDGESFTIDKDFYDPGY